MSYTLPSDVNDRPIAIDGAGMLGRRIASVFAAGGTDVRIFDISQAQRDAARDYVNDQIQRVKSTLNLTESPPGQVLLFDDLTQAVRGAWMVIEAIPEQLDLKREAFRQLDEVADADAILASNSSSFPTSRLIGSVKHPERVLNTHYQQPPELNAVELMSCGKTDEAVIDALMDKVSQYGLVPFRVRRESDGFIFNRVWAAIKRECLMVVEEGVATLPEGPRKLLHTLVDQGKLGVKSGQGFYDYG